MAKIPVRELTKEEVAGLKYVKQHYYCETCHDDFGNGLRFGTLPHCTECGEHHSDAVTCEEFANVKYAERKAGWDPKP